MKAWCSNDVYLLKNTAFEFNELSMIDAVPPPLLPSLVENKKLQFGGEASVRTAGASVPSHVSVKRRQFNLLSKITSFIKKVLFKRERTLKSAMLIVTAGWVTGEVDCCVSGLRL